MRGLVNSSMIEYIEYLHGKLFIAFRKHTKLSPIIYVDVPIEEVISMVSSSSPGSYYLQNIKSKFKTQKTLTMADKIIKLKIDVKKLNKDWLFVGEKGVYLNCTLLYNEEQDARGNNGMIVQDVPTEVYKKDKSIKGEILGNAKEFSKTPASKETEVGNNEGLRQGTTMEDDLPF